MTGGWSFLCTDIPKGCVAARPDQGPGTFTCSHTQVVGTQLNLLLCRVYSGRKLASGEELCSGRLASQLGTMYLPPSVTLRREGREDIPRAEIQTFWAHSFS